MRFPAGLMLAGVLGCAAPNPSSEVGPQAEAIRLEITNGFTGTGELRLSLVGHTGKRHLTIIGFSRQVVSIAYTPILRSSYLALETPFSIPWASQDLIYGPGTCLNLVVGQSIEYSALYPCQGEQ